MPPMSLKQPALLLVIGATLSILAWIAAPAHAKRAEASPPPSTSLSRCRWSTQLRAPSPRSERVAARHNGYGLEGRVLYRSVPVSAPHRFDVVGVAGEMHALEFRARRDGRPWSDWVESDNGDPVFTGGTDQVQLRSRGGPRSRAGSTTSRSTIARCRPSNCSPAAPRARARVGGGGSPRLRASSPARSGARTPSEAVAKPRTKPELGKVKAGVVHPHGQHQHLQRGAGALDRARHLPLPPRRQRLETTSATTPSSTASATSTRAARAGSPGRSSVPRSRALNSQTTGIAAIGDQRSTPATNPERKSIIRYLAWKFELAGIRANGTASLLSAGGSTQRTPRRPPRAGTANLQPQRGPTTPSAPAGRCALRSPRSGAPCSARSAADRHPIRPATRRRAAAASGATRAEASRRRPPAAGPAKIRPARGRAGKKPSALAAAGELLVARRDRRSARGCGTEARGWRSRA